MKTTIKLVLTLVLFTSFAVAGDQGTGGYKPCDPEIEICPPPPSCMENCPEGNSMVAGGGSSDEGANSAVFDAVDVISPIETAIASTIALLGS